jgi:hypothetical protein
MKSSTLLRLIPRRAGRPERETRFRHRGVEALPDALPDVLDNLIRRPGLAVGPVGAQRVPHVHNGKNPRSHRLPIRADEMVASPVCGRHVRVVVSGYEPESLAALVWHGRLWPER